MSDDSICWNGYLLLPPGALRRKRYTGSSFLRIFKVEPVYLGYYIWYPTKLWINTKDEAQTKNSESRVIKEW
jgi:hypothetical protein